MAVSLGDDNPPSTGPTCPVCFRDYSDSEANLIPRILQCGHTYCTGKVNGTYNKVDVTNSVISLVRASAFFLIDTRLSNI